MEANEFLLERYRTETARLIRMAEQMVENGLKEVSGSCEVWIMARQDVNELMAAVTDAYELLMEEDPARSFGEEWPAFKGAEVTA